MQFFTAAMAEGAVVRQFCEAIDIELSGDAVSAVRYIDYEQRRERRVDADVVINAAGVWASRVAALCGMTIAVNAQAGTMVAVNGRLCDCVLNRLAPAGDGDIIVPQRGLTIVGTTSHDCDDIDAPHGSDDEVRYLQRRADELLPGFSDRAIHAVWAAVRPLAGEQDDDPRAISRKLVCHNHRKDGVGGLFTISGGKATTLRAMAEQLMNEIDRDSGNSAQCTTAERPLAPFQEFYAYYSSDANRAAVWET